MRAAGVAQKPSGMVFACCAALNQKSVSFPAIYEYGKSAMKESFFVGIKFFAVSDAVVIFIDQKNVFRHIYLLEIQ